MDHCSHLCYTKWVKAVPFKPASGSFMANFIQDNIICRFGIPKHILYDNSTLFINIYLRELCKQYRVEYVKSILYSRHRNGQTEPIKKNVIKILSRMV